MSNGFLSQAGSQLRVQGVLAVTRAIGDNDYKDFIISEPEVTEIELHPETDSYLLISTDGLYKTLSKEFVAQKVIE